MFNFCFPKWLSNYKKLIKKSAKTGLNVGNNQHYDEVIKLLSVSVTDDDNIEQFQDQDLVPHIVLIALKTNSKHDRYIPVLEIIAGLSNAEEEVADTFIDENIHYMLTT